MNAGSGICSIVRFAGSPDSAIEDSIRMAVSGSPGGAGPARTAVCRAAALGRAINGPVGVGVVGSSFFSGKVRKSANGFSLCGAQEAVTKKLARKKKPTDRQRVDIRRV